MLRASKPNQASKAGLNENNFLSPKRGVAILQALLGDDVINTWLCAQFFTQAYRSFCRDGLRYWAGRVIQVTKQTGADRADIHAGWGGFTIFTWHKAAIEPVIDSVDAKSTLFNHTSRAT